MEQNANKFEYPNNVYVTIHESIALKDGGKVGGFLAFDDKYAVKKRLDGGEFYVRLSSLPPNIQKMIEVNCPIYQED